ncbi:MAG: hypothetical protein K8R63_06360 [Bacteroidales bacterium]|nr:hypothetical protein [Bacteroidales bacterium]
MKKITFMLLAFSFCIISDALSQGVAINTTGADPDNSAMLDVVSTTKGVLIPRMTQTQRNAISSPATGLMIFQTDNTAGLYCFDGSSWEILASGAIAINDLLDGKTGGNSVFLGSGAGTNDDATDNRNVGLGINALNANTSGSNNTSIGAYSLQANVGGGGNSALGTSTLTFNATGWFNNAFGYQSLYWNTAGSSNNALGYMSLNSNTTGHYNIGIGQEANRFNQEGSYNTVIGYQAGRGTSTHNISYNVFLGCQAGYNETGSNRLYIENSNSATPLIYGEFDNDLLRVNGDFEATGDIDISSGSSYKINGLDILHNEGSFNIFLGANSGSTGSNNSFFGENSGANNNGGLYNTFIGRASGYNNITGNYNTYLGGNAGMNSTGSSNVFLGYWAGANEAGSNKLYIDNSNSATPLIYGEFDSDLLRVNGTLDINNAYQFPTADGTSGQVLQSDGSGTLSWASDVGASEINDLTDGKTDTTSVFLGAGSGTNDDGTANRNVAIGIDAFEANTSGYANSAYGYQALYKNTDGDANTASGNRALRNNTTGSSNTALGASALGQNTSGEFNVGIGIGANYSNQEGDNNTMIGYCAGCGASNHNKFGNIFIGYSAGYFETGDYKLYIESSTSSTPLIYGEFNNDLLKFNAEVELANGTSASSLKFYERSIAGTNFTKFKSQDQAGDVTYTLPAADGSSGQVLQSNGSGVLSWNDDGGATEIDELTDGKTDTTSVFLGSNAGINDDGSDNHNVAFGIDALRANTTGDCNTATGYQSLQTNNGIRNTASGYRALRKNTGNYNTAFGFEAMRWHTSGSNNVAIGNNALVNNLSGSNNTIIGSSAGLGTGSGNISGNVFLGYWAGANETGDNKLYIDNSSSSTPLIGGDFSTNKVTINDVLKLAPRASAPTGPTEGEIYVNSTNNHIYCYLGGSWKQLDN